MIAVQGTKLTFTVGAREGVNPISQVRHQPRSQFSRIRKLDEGLWCADTADVTFTYFSLKHNSAFDIGRPPYYFESTTSLKAKKQYCDVDEAFRQELGLGTS